MPSNRFAVVFGILAIGVFVVGTKRGADLPTIAMIIVAGGVGFSILWALALQRRNRGGIQKLRSGATRFAPIWLASPEHLARVEAMWRSAPRDGTPMQVPDDIAAVTLPHGERFPVLFEAVGKLDVIGNKAVLRPNPEFLETGKYRNVKYEITLELALPTSIEVHTAKSPAGERFSTDWLRVSGLDVETFMICVGSTGTDASASREMTRQLHELLAGTAPATR